MVTDPLGMLEAVSGRNRLECVRIVEDLQRSRRIG